MKSGPREEQIPRVKGAWASKELDRLWVLNVGERADEKERRRWPAKDSVPVGIVRGRRNQRRVRVVGSCVQGKHSTVKEGKEDRGTRAAVKVLVARHKKTSENERVNKPNLGG